jgi:signal peptidase II
VNLFFLAAGGAFVSDWATKLWVARRLGPGERLDLIPGILSLEHVRNPGAAFGLLADWPGGGVLFLLASALALGMAGWFLLARRNGSFPLRHPLLDLSVGAIAGGVLGNLRERISRGEVTDFLALPFWPVFNLADVFIVLGGAVLALFLLRREFHLSSAE